MSKKKWQNRVQKNIPRCPFEGGGGSKAICPTNTFQKGATLTTLILLPFLNYWVQKGVCFNKTSIHLFHQRVLHSGVLCTAEITFLLLNGILSLCFEFQLFVVVLSIYVYLMEPYTRIKKFSPYLVVSQDANTCKQLATVRGNSRRVFLSKSQEGAGLLEVHPAGCRSPTAWWR